MDGLAGMSPSMDISAVLPPYPPSHVLQEKDAGIVLYFSLWLSLPWIMQIWLVVLAGQIGCDGCNSPD